MLMFRYATQMSSPTTDFQSTWRLIPVNFWGYNPGDKYLGDYQVTLWSWVPINGDLMVHIYVSLAI